MTQEQVALSQIIIGIITGGVGVAIINWLAGRGKNRASQNIDMQEYWHKEFKRLEKRIDDVEVEKREGDAEIKTLKAQVEVLQGQLRDKDGEIERLTARIRQLERLMKKYGIDPDKVSEDKPNE